MPTKDQCIDCKHRTTMGDCAISGTYIKYDDVSCIRQTKRKKRMFEQPFSFKGRIRRTEYWLSSLVYVIYCSFLGLIDLDNLEQQYHVLFLLLCLPAVWFMIAQGAKRCHDRGNSGWYQIIPFYGLWMLFAKGDKKSNRYGESPK
ncbi:DUF805 domain-containing protein [Bacteroides sp.]|uniref:DUF805 domain-containing protein n=1 Tax=Bacteroides sp. TaxID=29523 RepID=UPI0025BDADDE|nr:DUF805 domain-containing protein [Bacteroides sp.]